LRTASRKNQPLSDITPESRSDSLLNLVAQDEIILVPDTLRFETVSDLSIARHEVERTVYGKVSWAF
jgi:hypothetical protein